MAEKRMFTQKILESDDYLDMPFSARCLYVALNMNADDDGFLNCANKIIRITGASEEDLQILINKRFILDFGNGVIVIKHWKMHNTLKKDRYKPTQYQTQFNLLTVKENGSYTERNQSGTNLEPERNHSVDKSSKEEISLGEESVVGEVDAINATPTLAEIKEYIVDNNLSVNPNRFFSYYDEQEWKTTHGNPIKWQDKLHEWDFDDKQKAKANAKPETQANSNPFLALAKEENLL